MTKIQEKLPLLPPRDTVPLWCYKSHRPQQGCPRNAEWSWTVFRCWCRCCHRLQGQSPRWSRLRLWSSLEARIVAGTSSCEQIAEITGGESQSLSGQRGLITNLRSFIVARYPRNFVRICWSSFCQHGTMPPQDTLTQIPGMKLSFNTPSSSSSPSSSSPRGLLVVGSNVSS